MNNYEYIIASLPDIRQGEKASCPDPESIIEEIRGLLSGKDTETFGRFLDGFEADKLDEAFYKEMFSSRNAFVRDYFLFDLNLRNTKTEYLNERLGRPGMQDMLFPEEYGDFEGKEDVRRALETDDILERERALDNMMWKKVEELTELHVFDLDIILGFVARLKTVQRWLKLDPESGRELFRKLVNEIKTNRNI